ncbi:MAG: ADP-ribosylglycohydrolase family protein, partial [Candidatus Dependentiae bacterium]
MKTLYKLLLTLTLFSPLGAADTTETKEAVTPTYQDTIEQRIFGCLVYGSIGDSRGNPVEFDSFNGGFANLGNKPVTTLNALPTTLPSFRNGAHIVTDDTIMTELTLQACLEWRKDDEPGGVNGLMKKIAQATLDNHDLAADDYRWSGSGRAPGPTCINGIESFRTTGKWDLRAAGKHQPGKGGGCGKVMDSAA